MVDCLICKVYGEVSNPALLPNGSVIHDAVFRRIEYGSKKARQPPSLFGKKNIRRECQEENGDRHDGKDRCKDIVEARGAIQLPGPFFQQLFFMYDAGI